jgi:aminoglycoside phosphotransferase (APT) family kinase protein
MTSMKMPEAEVNIDSALVRALLQEQRPELADLPLVELANGWDNVVYRLGSDFTVRIPRRVAAAELVENEQRWLPMFAARLPLPIPAPVWSGRPGCNYPWSWSLCPWLPGETAAVTPPTDMLDAARSLGEFLAALHVAAPSNAPVNPFRGIPLEQRTDRMHAAAETLDGVIDGPAARALWAKLVSAPPSTTAVWIHGDLHPANILVNAGKISGVIDFGDITSGDRATDLAVAWMLFPPEVRLVFREAAGALDNATWERSRAWAIALSLAYLVGSADNPMMHDIGMRTLAAALESD